MKARIAFGVLLGWALPWAAVAQAAAPSQNYWVEAAVNTAVVYVGQPFHYNLTAGIKNGVIRLPGAAVIWPGCRLLSYQEKDVSDRHEGYQARQGQYTLAPFALDKIEFPSLALQLAWPDGTTATVKSAPVTLTIASRNPQGLALRESRLPRSVPPIWFYTLIVIGILLNLIIWVDYFLQSRRRARARKPPHLEAYRQLDVLGKSKLVQDGQVDLYFTELSRILRKYLAERYSFPAMEQPRTEIMAALAQQQIRPHTRRLINSLLIQADLIKFAKLRAHFSRMAVAQRRARQFVDLTRPVEERKTVAALK